MAFLEKAEKQDLILLAEDLGLKVSHKMTVTDLKNIIIGSRDYEEEFGKAYLSVISEERVEKETEEKIVRQHSIEQLRWESEPSGELTRNIFRKRKDTLLRYVELKAEYVQFSIFKQFNLSNYGIQ
ncbi:hypothetical protein TNCV_4561171 [Trichonephila clavipes]|nr:hypothetical protein TNCV_4561171 [Trichonephila clavipes]